MATLETLAGKHFVDPELNPDNLTACHLYLHLSFESLTYIVFSPQTNHIYACYTYEGITSQTGFDLVFSKDTFLKAQYQKVKVMFSNALFTFVPDELFDEGCISTYLNFNLLEPDSFFQERNRVQALNSNTLFCFYREPKIVVNKYHPDNKVFHSSTPLIEGTLRETQGPGKRLFIFGTNLLEIEILALEDGKLLLYNYFQVSSEEEFIYYPLYIVQQLWVSREGVGLVTGGILDAEHPRTAMLKTYFPQLSPIKLPEALSYSPLLYEKTGSIAWSLAWLSQCE